MPHVEYIQPDNASAMNNELEIIKTNLYDFGIDLNDEKPFSETNGDDGFGWSDYSELDAIKTAAENFAKGIDIVLKDIAQLPKDK